MPLCAPVPVSTLLSLCQDAPSISVSGDFQSFSSCSWRRTLLAIFLSFTLKLYTVFVRSLYTVSSNSQGEKSPTNVCKTILSYWSSILSLQDMFLHATQRKHKIRGDSFIRNNLGLTPLTLAAKLGRKEMFHEILEYQSMVRNEVFSHDVKTAILVSKHNKTLLSSLSFMTIMASEDTM